MYLDVSTEVQWPNTNPHFAAHSALRGNLDKKGSGTTGQGFTVWWIVGVVATCRLTGLSCSPTSKYCVQGSPCCLSVTLLLFLISSQNRILSNLTPTQAFIFYKQVSRLRKNRRTRLNCILLGNKPVASVTAGNTLGYLWPCLSSTWQSSVFFKWNFMQAVVHWYLSIIMTSLGYL